MQKRVRHFGDFFSFSIYKGQDKSGSDFLWKESKRFDFHDQSSKVPEYDTNNNNTKSSLK